ncbi:hypothetical protein SO802_024408 [Lithocarpus litseifolius]|uniref:Bidirectional sugar transporter SWEET n=1 Tax=Lithocarpus litseifolius TaxID=425828 RepID=A0AAW2CCH2_9ROSI
MYENHGVQKKAAMILTPGIVAICITMVISAFVFHDHHHRKIFIGSVGLLVAATMYGSPLVVMKQVIVTKSVEFMPFYLSLFSFLASSFWMAYGLVSNELFLAAPNLLGSPLGFLQLVLYFKYRKGGVVEESKKWDLEKDDAAGVLYNRTSVSALTVMLIIWSTPVVGPPRRPVGSRSGLKIPKPHRNMLKSTGSVPNRAGDAEIWPDLEEIRPDLEKNRPDLNEISPDLEEIKLFIDYSE